jgi:hypothetical protein
MIKWIFPRPGDTFFGWIGRLILIICLVISPFALKVYVEEKYQPVEPPPYEWIGLDPSRPVSDISHRDYVNGIVYYRERGPYTEKTNTKRWESECKYTEEQIEDIFIDNDLINDYEYLYEMYRD